MIDKAFTAGRQPEQIAKPSSGLACSPAGITPPPVIDSGQLMGGAKLLVIDHAGEQYRLMVTKNDKLILQK